MNDETNFGTPSETARADSYEKELTKEQRHRYDDFLRKQTEMQKHAQDLLARRFLAFHDEQRKHVFTVKPEKLVGDSTAPLEFREVARELMAQRQQVADLAAQQQRDKLDFLRKCAIENLDQPRPVAQASPSCDHDVHAREETRDEQKSRLKDQLAKLQEQSQLPKREHGSGRTRK